MQIWIDIYPAFPEGDKRVEEYRKYMEKVNGYYVFKNRMWRIVIDTLRNKFVILNGNDKVIKYDPYSVQIVGGLYCVSDIPTKNCERSPGGFCRNIIFKVKPFCIEVLEGGGWYKHVLWINGYKVAEKLPFKYWKKVKCCKITYNIFQLNKLIKYELLLRSKIIRR